MCMLYDICRYDMYIYIYVKLALYNLMLYVCVDMVYSFQIYDKCVCVYIYDIICEMYMTAYVKCIQMHM